MQMISPMETLCFDVASFDAQRSDEELARIIQDQKSEDQLPALKELIRRESPLCEKIAQKVLKEASYHRRIKNTAITFFSNLGNPQNSKTLLDALHQVEDKMRFRIAWTLGMIGDESVLKDLEGSALYSEATKFACSLIAYRYGIKRHFLDLKKVRSVEKIEEGVKIEMKNIIPISRSANIRGKESRITEASIAPNPILEIECQGESLLVYQSDGFQSKSSFQKLKKQNAIPFQVLRVDHCPDMESLAFHVMTHPAPGNEIALALVSPEGEISYIGSLQITGDRVDFLLQTVEGVARPPVDIRGIFELGKQNFTLERASSGFRVSKKWRKQPRKVDLSN